MDARAMEREGSEAPFASPDRALLSLHGISKQYPGVVALSDVSLEFRQGEVHALIGENGAGKSTLIKTLSGAVDPTSGWIEMDGKKYHGLTPAQARELGIAVIYQEFTLIPELSAAENIFLGDFPLIGPILDRKSMWARAAELFARLGVQIDPKTPVQGLTTGYQQIVEIAKALSRDARVLVMDEPSAPLTTSEVEAMFDVVATLKEHGVTVIYISHRLEEIFRIADRVSVLRDGKYIRSLNVVDTNKSELIRLMVGRDLSETFPQRTTGPGEVTIQVRNLSGNGVRDISFEARRGEILGFAGLVGAGRTELMEMLFGVAPVASGEIHLHGRPIRPKDVVSAISSGLALVPEDRKRHGVILDLTVRDNISLPLLRRISTLGVVRRRRERAVADKYRDALRIKTPSLSQKLGNLSGGNQQKVVLAKWLAMDADTFIFDEPTRGIDVGAREEIYTIMNDLAAEGKTLIMISSDMEELLGMSDRMVVLCRGRLAGTLTKSEFSQERILTMASGAE